MTTGIVTLPMNIHAALWSLATHVIFRRMRLAPASGREAATGRDVQLGDTLSALRDVRPRIQTSFAQDGLPRALYEELLELPARVDALKWLEAERSAEVAALAFLQSLELGRLIHDVPNRLTGIALTADQQEGVARLLEQLRRLYGQPGKHRLPAEASPTRSLVDPGPDTLLADLLRLPSSTDPVRWLQENRLPLCSRLVLERLIQDVCSSEKVISPILTGDRLRSITPKVRTCSDTGLLWVEVKKLDIHKSGFAIRLGVCFSVPSTWSYVRRSGDIVEWEGFRNATDDAGRRYVLRVASMDTSTQLWWWTGELTLVGWPKFEDASELTLEAAPAFLSLYRKPSEGSSFIPIPGPSLGEARCTVVVDRSKG